MIDWTHVVLPAITVLISGIFSLGVGYMTFRLASRKIPSEIRGSDSQTMLNLTKMTKDQTDQLMEARREITEVREQIGDLLDRLKGTHRLTVEFEMNDLLEDGQADLHNGRIVIIKREKPKIM